MKRFLFLCLFLLVFAGCSDKVKVKGNVAYSDGSLITDGNYRWVLFENEKYTLKGEIKDDGSFQLGSFTETDGIPRGKYKVGIVLAELDGDGIPDENFDASKFIDKKFLKSDTSGIEYDVKKPLYDVKIVVEKPAGKKK